VLLLLVWELACRALGVPSYLLPSPSRIAEAVAQAPGALLGHAGFTLLEAVLGFLIGSALGAAFAEWRLLARGLLPYVVAANTIPVVAIAPILILWFGHGLASKVAVTAFLSFFPLAINTMKGLVSYDRTVMATGDPQLQGGLAAAASQGRDIAFFGWDDIPQPFLKPLEDGRIKGFLKQSPDVGGEMAVRLLVKHLDGEEIPPRFTYNPSVVTRYNLEQFR
jgi:hypothetical protein